MSNKIVMAIDPGDKASAFVLWDGQLVLYKDKVSNEELLDRIRCMNKGCHILVIEKIMSYGMPVSSTVFDTVFWSGQFYNMWTHTGGKAPIMIPRIEVKKAICHNGNAKDSNVARALVDRFAPGEPNMGKGTGKDPGFFYGFAADIWQAFALAVAYTDAMETVEPWDI